MRCATFLCDQFQRAKNTEFGEIQVEESETLLTKGWRNKNGWLYMLEWMEQSVQGSKMILTTCVDDDSEKISLGYDENINDLIEATYVL